jgi:hypothetical protein
MAIVIKNRALHITAPLLPGRRWRLHVWSGIRGPEIEKKQPNEPTFLHVLNLESICKGDVNVEQSVWHVRFGSLADKLSPAKMRLCPLLSESGQTQV